MVNWTWWQMENLCGCLSPKFQKGETHSKFLPICIRVQSNSFPKPFFLIIKILQRKTFVYKMVNYHTSIIKTGGHNHIRLHWFCIKREQSLVGSFSRRVKRVWKPQNKPTEIQSSLDALVVVLLNICFLHLVYDWVVLDRYNRNKLNSWK